MKATELKNKYLNFFKEKGHIVIPSASLVPVNDPTSLFISAGMQPLVPYLMGEKHPEGNKLVNIQRCVRTGDIDEVGDESHLTYFEMMGHWSLGSYWKKEAIDYIFEFLTKELNIDLKNLAVTCFEGDPQNNIPKDIESADAWKSLGISEARIAYLGYEDNFWGPVGNSGPCGPDTELFVWTGEGNAPEKFDPDCSDWMELCNDVFMEYNKTKDGKYEPLVQKNVDFGMGFERLLSYLEGKSDIYKTEVYKPIIEKIEEISGKKYEENKKTFRVIADHLKTAVNIISDGVEPTNKGQGYVVRRLLRKIMAFLYLMIGKKYDNEMTKLVTLILNIGEAENQDKVLDEIKTEESKFFNVLISGIDSIPQKMNPDLFFDFYQSHGLYPEIILGIMSQKGYKNIDKEWYMKEFNIRLKKHQELSKTASAGMFKGGLADAGEETKKLHTAAHLMLVALKKVLGCEVEQKGSNITAERLRFDFNWPEKLTPRQIKEVEDMVNEQIEKDLPVIVDEMSLEEAKKSGAHGTFNDRYGNKVKVYSIGNFSKEICGGPHVEHTGQLGHFKIKKEQSSSAGVRRIKAVLEK